MDNINNLKDDSLDIEFKISLAPYTTFKIGGHCKQLLNFTNLFEIRSYLKSIELNRNILWLGAGSNLLVRDGGFEGTVIRTSNFNRIIRIDRDRIYCEAGVKLQNLLDHVVVNELQGLEFLAGIPGTFGGALYMNAGAYGSSIWDFIESVLIIDRLGEIKRRFKKEYKIGYRYQKRKIPNSVDEWFLGGFLKLNKTFKDKISEKVANILAKRVLITSIKYPNVGSIFKNPPGLKAAELIENSGLKGLQKGGAAISEQHANFIINYNNASSNDVEWLMTKVVSSVQEKFNLILKPEIKIVGQRI